jgi:hypothetical protein
VFDGIDATKQWLPALSVYREAEVRARFERPFAFDPGDEFCAAGELREQQPSGLFSSQELVKWMRSSLEAGDHMTEAWNAIDTALVPAHELPF